MCFDSPVIQKIRQDCSKEFAKFEMCLRENQDKPTSCSPQVARFLGCAESVDLSGLGKSLLELALHSCECRRLKHKKKFLILIFRMLGI